MKTQQFTLQKAGLSRQICRVRSLPSLFFNLMHSKIFYQCISIQQKQAAAFRVRKVKTRSIFRTNRAKKSIALALGLKQHTEMLNY